MDNGPQFVSQELQDMCERYGIQLHHSSPYYPQGNGQAEATNKTLIKILKKTCESNKFADWPEKTNWCSVGLSHFYLNTYWTDPVCPDVRNGRDFPIWDFSTFTKTPTWSRSEWEWIPRIALSSIRTLRWEAIKGRWTYASLSKEIIKVLSKKK